MTFKVLGDPNRNMVGRLLGGSGRGGFQWNQELTFEGGNIVTPPVNAWDSIGGVGAATILTTGAAAIRGNFGSEIGMPDASARFGIMTQPTNEKKFLLDFLFDPNSIVLAAANRFIFINAPFKQE